MPYASLGIPQGWCLCTRGWGNMNRLRPGRRDSGAAAVETALVLPIVILIVFGIIEFGILFNRLQGVHAASREAARLGSLLDVTIDEIQARSESAAPPFVDLEDLQVTVHRIDVLEDGMDSTVDSWTWNPATDTWSGGTTNTGTEAPCASGSEPPGADEDAGTNVATAANVRVELELLNPGDYGVTIPLFGSFAFGHPSVGEFRCEF